MHAVAAAVVAVVAADEIDPATVRPSPLSSVVFTFLLVALILLLWSFVRHLRRAQANLGSAWSVDGTEVRSEAPSADTDQPEGDSR